MIDLYCNFYRIHNKYVCGKCGATIACNNLEKAPLSVCAIFITQHQFISPNRSTPFGIPLSQQKSSNSKNGPGTQLKKILGLLNIKDTLGCSCSEKSQIMNYWGKKKCFENIDKIVDWLEKEAKKRKILFCKLLAKSIVAIAIWSSKD